MKRIFNRLLGLTCGQALAISVILNATLFSMWIVAVLLTAQPAAGEIEHKSQHLQQLRNR